ncbi:MAG: DUF1572 family protein [Bacteroidia bacterium]
MIENYLDAVRKQFQYYQLLGEKTFALLDDEQLFWQYNPESNSVAVMVKHLWGNMLSRWTDFLTADGEKDWRDRDGEFEATIQNREELLTKWAEGWDCVFQAMDSITPEHYESVIYIRNMGHSIPEAINRQLAHYAYHVGQIVYLGRMLKGADWQSLSIPKGESKTFNKQKFSKPKRIEHFTEEFLEKEE